jgi:hypothetical protein
MTRTLSVRTMRMRSSFPAYTWTMIRSTASFPRFGRNVVMLGCSIALGAGAIYSVPLVAQRGPAQRIVQGKVMDKSEAGLSGAVVYLKDDHTLSLKSFIADSNGGYRFGQLSQNTDYELWAESNGKKSPTKTISSFDSKNSFQIDLKIDTGK